MILRHGLGWELGGATVAPPLAHSIQWLAETMEPSHRFQWDGMNGALIVSVEFVCVMEKEFVGGGWGVGGWLGGWVGGSLTWAGMGLECSTGIGTG